MNGRVSTTAQPPTQQPIFANNAYFNRVQETTSATITPTQQPTFANNAFFNRVPAGLQFVNSLQSGNQQSTTTPQPTTQQQPVFSNNRAQFESQHVDSAQNGNRVSGLTPATSAPTWQSIFPNNAFFNRVSLGTQPVQGVQNGNHPFRPTSAPAPLSTSAPTQSTTTTPAPTTERSTTTSTTTSTTPQSITTTDSPIIHIFVVKKRPTEPPINITLATDILPPLTVYSINQTGKAHWNNSCE